MHVFQSSSNNFLAFSHTMAVILQLIQITCLFFLSGKLLYKKYLCWFFTEAVSHRARAFGVSVKQTHVTEVV